MTDVLAPRLLDSGHASARAELTELRAAGIVTQLIDQMPSIAEELFRVEYPFVVPGTPEYAPTLARYLDRHWNGGNYDASGVWALYTWRGAAVHLPPEGDFLRLRAARNRFLITEDEQTMLRRGSVAVAGLSIGLSAVLALVLTMAPSSLRIADPDVLELPNLNRMAASVCELGTSKVTIAARRATELDPFLRIRPFPRGVTDSNLGSFLGGDPSVQLLVEEMDDIRMKVQARFVARRLGVPVVMATDDGDNTIIDVERFDLEADRPLFHGRVDESSLRRVSPDSSLTERIRVGNAIVGAEVAPRMQRSLRLVGSRIPMWPQLGTAASLSGVAVAYVARRILTDAEMPSGRYRVSLDGALDAGFHKPSAVAAREWDTREFELEFEAMFGG